MSKSDKVRMFIRVGKDEVPLGECHPAQARSLVKKEYASWSEGNLLVLGRPAFLKMMEDGDHWVTAREKTEVSGSELDRRKIWFRGFMSQAVKALAKTHEATPRNWSHLDPSRKSGFTVEEPIQAQDLNNPEDDVFYENPVQVDILDLPDEVIFHSKEIFHEPLTFKAEDGKTYRLEDLWEKNPDVSKWFGTPSTNSYVGPGMGGLAPLEDQEAVEVFNFKAGMREVNPLSIAGGRVEFSSPEEILARLQKEDPQEAVVVGTHPTNDFERMAVLKSKALKEIKPE